MESRFQQVTEDAGSAVKMPLLDFHQLSVEECFCSTTSEPHKHILKAVTLL